MDKKRKVVLCLIATILVVVCYIGLSTPKEKIIFKSNYTIEKEQSTPTITVVKETEEIPVNQSEVMTASLQIELAVAILIVLATSFLLCKHVARKNHIFIKKEVGGELLMEQEVTKQPVQVKQTGVMSGELL